MLTQGESDEATGLTGDTEPRRGALTPAMLRDAVVVGGVTLLAFVSRAHTALAPIETQDERSWMHRTTIFSDALHSGDISQMSGVPHGTAYPKTMPGVSTMWVGTFARWVWGAGRELGMWTGVDALELGGGDTFDTTRSGLQVAQMAMALATALLMGLVAYLVARWVGHWAAAIAGALIATEPFLVAHGTVLHTDELLSLFGVASLIAAALVLALPSRTEWAGKRWAAVFAGVLGGAALVTKVSALMFIAGVGLLGLWAVVRAWRASSGGTNRLWQALRPTASLGGWWVAGFIVVVLIAYPALWARPFEEVGHLRRSALMAGDGHLQYFLGEPSETPGPAYYLVATPLRSTPWLLVASAMAVVALWRRPATRGFAVALTAMVGPTFVIISLASKQFDRYGIPLMILGGVAVGIAAASAIPSLKRPWAQWLQGRQGRGALVAVAGVLLVHGLVVSPWGMSYFNPLLGGSSVGERALMVGWGEGSDEVGRLIAEHAGDACDEVTVYGGAGGRSSDYRCGRRAPAAEATYVVTHVSLQQRVPDDVSTLVEGRELVATVRIRGIDHFEIYGPRT